MPKPQPYGRVTTARPRRIQILANQGTQSATSGEVSQSWVTVAWATTIDWRSGSGSVRQMADEPRADDSAVIRIRYRTDLTITPRLHRVQDSAGRVYDVNAAIDVNNQHQYIDLYVREAAQ